MNTKLDTQLSEILATNDFKDLVGHEILFKFNYGTLPRSIYWVRVLDISPNGNYVKIQWLENADNEPYFVDINTLELLDVLKDSKVL